MPNDISPAPMSEPSFFILLSLASGPLHGYAMLKKIELISEGRISLSVSTLYTTLSRLQDQGLIERVDSGDEDASPGLPRKVYRLTGQGQRALEAEAKRLHGLLAAYHQQLAAENK